MKPHRIKIAWRGWRMNPFAQLKPIGIGQTRLYLLGPIALFLRPKWYPCLVTRDGHSLRYTECVFPAGHVQPHAWAKVGPRG